MIKKYTGLIFIMITLLMCGGVNVHAMSDVNLFSPDVVNEDFGFMQEQDEPVILRNGKSANVFADDALTEDFVVWSANGSIYIRAAKAVDVNIYTITGQLSKRMKITAGENVIPVTRGLYIVRIENIARKVIVK